MTTPSPVSRLPASASVGSSSSQQFTKSSGSASSNMLSLNFTQPLPASVRAERIHHMVNNHPAYTKTREAQSFLVQLGTKLRRMPGFSSTESEPIVAQLQDVGRVISQEATHLIESLASMTITQQEGERALAQHSLNANLAEGRAEDQARMNGSLKEQLASSKEQCRKLESDLQELMQKYDELTREVSAGHDGNDEAIKVGESASSPKLAGADMKTKNLKNHIEQLEDQVNNRRSMWIMKHSDPQSIARAMQTLANSVSDREALQQTLMSLQAPEYASGFANGGQQKDANHSYMQSPPFPQPNGRTQSMFQPIARPGTVAPPPKFGPLQNGPPRAPSAMARPRPTQSGWGPPTSNHRSMPSTEQLFSPPYNRGQPPSSRRGSFAANGRYPRPGAAEFQPSGFAVIPSAEGHGMSRPTTAIGQRREILPQTPTSGPRNRYGRFNDVNGRPSMTEFNELAQRPSNGPGPMNGNTAVGPLIHLSERTVNAWSGRISEFYDAIRTFVGRHAGDVYGGAVMDLKGTPLWKILIGTYHPLSESEAASYLEYHLHQDSSKACLVTRVIIDFVVNTVWVPGAWAGVDPESSRALREVEMDFKRTEGLPSTSRQPLLDRQAAVLDAIMKRDDIPILYKAKLEEIAGSLLTTIQPLINHDSTPNQAYKDLRAVAESAWELSSAILTSRLTFDFRFPEIGSRFSAQSMLPIWPATDPLELQGKHYRVAMVTTPVITCRNDTGANISAHSVSLADVFCMQ